jgi:hypothetical protein
MKGLSNSINMADKREETMVQKDGTSDQQQQLPMVEAKGSGGVRSAETDVSTT